MNGISKRNDSFTSIFHLLIIAMFLLGLHGCGYKAPPFYGEEEAVVVDSDENVEFKLRKVNVENNASAECVEKK